MKTRGGFAYLFERFPSFTQTFCVREIQGWHRLGHRFPVFSIRSVEAEEVRHFPPELYEQTRTLPDVDALARRWWTPFSFLARSIKKQLYAEWGVEGGRRRAAEAAWLGPRLLREGVSHVHVHFAGLAARTAFWLRRRFGITYSFTAHANDFFVDAPGLFLDDLFRESRFVVTVSDFALRQLAGRFPHSAGKLHRVYNGVDVAAFSCADHAFEKTGAFRPQIVSVGRYIEKKGFPCLIAACAELGDMDFHCHLVGQGPLEGRMIEQIRAAGIEDKVFVTGPKPEIEIRKLLAQSQIFALACATERGGGMDNLPTVIMEAMAAGLPVVSTRLAGIPEMVEHGRTGILVQEGDVSALAAALRRLLENPAEALRMGAAGRELAFSRFDSAVTAEALREVFASRGVLKKN